MSTHVVNEFHAQPRRGEDVANLLIEILGESLQWEGCEAIRIVRDQDIQTTSLASPSGQGARTLRLPCLANCPRVHCDIRRDADAALRDSLLRRALYFGAGIAAEGALEEGKA